MQWLMNEFKQFKVDVAESVEKAIAKYAKEQASAVERIAKLEGEIKAMKMRAGKKE